MRQFIFSRLGYTCAEAQAHLEALFTEEMTWENWGPYWHIDHIKPLRLFQYESLDDDLIREAWALSNIRPLPAAENRKKGYRYDPTR